jgi:CubicO group peptidase (beta-lactamase class C family)
MKALEAYVHGTAVALGNCPTAIVVSRHGEILFEKYAAGIDGAAPLGPVDADSLWPIYSATKSYISALLLSLAKDGVLTLDDPVSGYLPEFGTHGEGEFDRRTVTIRHLASHTSGAVSAERSPDLNIVRIDTPPGEVFLYSGLGMHILEKTLEAAAGDDLEALLNERVILPMGLKHTRYVYKLDPSLPLLPVTNTEVDDPARNFSFVSKGMRAHYGLYGTARDCNRFGQMWLSNGTFEGHTYFTPEGKREAWSYHGTRDSDKGHYGLLWWLFEEDGGYVISGAGAKATAVVPETGVVITVLRLPLKPENGPFNFYLDKQKLAQVGKMLGEKSE